MKKCILMILCALILTGCAATCKNNAFHESLLPDQNTTRSLPRVVQ